MKENSAHTRIDLEPSCRFNCKFLSNEDSVHEEPPNLT